MTQWMVTSCSNDELCGVFLRAGPCVSDLLLASVQVGEEARRSQTHTVFVGQTGGGVFFAVCTCVVLQVRGARGATEDGGAEESGALRACEG